jgi:adenine phosphoribosyltransferase
MHGLQQRLRDAFSGAGENPAGFWRDPSLLADLGPALGALYDDDPPDMVAGIQSRGMLLGALVAQALGTGLVEIRKDLKHTTDSNVLIRTTPPDYKWRDLQLALLRGLIEPGQRVLLVDDWIETGAQAQAARALIEDAGGIWVGAATIVDQLPAGTRRNLGVRGLVRAAEL